VFENLGEHMKGNVVVRVRLSTPTVLPQSAAFSYCFGLIVFLHRFSTRCAPPSRHLRPLSPAARFLVCDRGPGCGRALGH
jgi:hypothetical protein